MLTVGKIARECSMEKLPEGLTVQAASQLGWRLRDGKYYKMIDVVQVYSSEGKDGGSPKILPADCEFGPFCDAIAKLADEFEGADNTARANVLQAMSQGIFYKANNASRPQGASSLEAIRQTYMAEALTAAGKGDPSMVVTFASTPMNQQGEFLRNWFTARNAGK